VVEYEIDKGPKGAHAISISSHESMTIK